MIRKRHMALEAHTASRYQPPKKITEARIPGHWGNEICSRAESLLLLTHPIASLTLRPPYLAKNQLLPGYRPEEMGLDPPRQWYFE